MRNSKFFLKLILLCIVLSLLTNLSNNQITNNETFALTDTNTLPQDVVPLYDPNDPSELESFMDSVMNEHMVDYNIPGATISVVNTTDVLFSKGYGYANLEEQTSVSPNETLFRVASISKLFTFTAVMQLVEQGLLDLDTDVNTYLSEFKIPDTYPEPITLSHLMSHTPGFEEKIFTFLPRSLDDLLSLEEYLSTRMPERIRPPGEISAYSNYGAALAGYIVAQVANTNFDEYIEDNIFNPLNMTHSSFRQPLPSGLLTDVVTEYSYEEGNYYPQEFGAIHATPAGSLSSTAIDMANFMIAHLQNGSFGGNRILQESTAQLMHTRHFSHDPRITGWAHGFMEDTINNQSIIWHGGDLAFSHSALVLVPEHNTGLFVCYSGGGSAVTRNMLLYEFFDHYFPIADSAEVEPPEDFRKRAGKFTGIYRTTRTDYSSLMVAPLLVFNTIRIDAKRDGTLMVIGLASTDIFFVEIDHLLFRYVDGSLLMSFREDSKGRITYMFIDRNPTIAYEKLTGFESIGFILTVLILCLGTFLSVLLVELIVFIYNRVKHKEKTPSPVLTHVARGMILGTSALNILFVLGLTITLLTADLATKIPAILIVLLIIPILTTISSAGLIPLTVFVWKDKYWNIVKRVHYSVTTFLAVVFVLWLFYWNLLGFHF